MENQNNTQHKAPEKLGCLHIGGLLFLVAILLISVGAWITRYFIPPQVLQNCHEECSTGSVNLCNLLRFLPHSRTEITAPDEQKKTPCSQEKS
jgi:hypothetical protein